MSSFTTCSTLDSFLGRDRVRWEGRKGNTKRRTECIFRWASKLSCLLLMLFVLPFCGLGCVDTIRFSQMNSTRTALSSVWIVYCHIQLFFSAGQIGDNEMRINLRGRVSLVLCWSYRSTVESKQSLQLHTFTQVRLRYTVNVLYFRHRCRRERWVCWLFVM